MDVLLGKDTEKVRNFGHEKLSVFGVGKGLAEAEWRSLFRQLVARGLVDIDLEIAPGEIHCLAGENGCGKSTLIKIISGAEQPDTGEITIDPRTGYRASLPFLGILRLDGRGAFVPAG